MSAVDGIKGADAIVAPDRPAVTRRSVDLTVILAHAVALGIGVCAFFLLLGRQTLLAKAPFLVSPTGDFAAEQASFVLVANDIWRFPFLALPQVNLPEGANAVFFGGTPLLALVARLWREVTGAASAPNLLGVWYLLCFALQAHSFFFLMRQITRKRPLLLAVCSVAAVLTYAFLTRFGHVSLFGQFFVIYAMGLVLATLRPETPWRRTLLLLAGVTVVAMLIFAYLAVSIGALFGAALLMLWWSGRTRLPVAVVAGAAYATLLLTVAWASGYFWSAARAEPVDMSSYAALGLNIGGLVIPPNSPVFPSHLLFRSWWEGDFYLGLSTMALLVLGIGAQPRAAWRGLVNAWPLVLVLSILTLYALSNRWAFGDTVLLQYPLPHWAAPIVGLARAGGRLFWPIGYLLIALGFALTVRAFGRASTVLVLCALALAGLEAVAPLRYVRNTAFASVSFPLQYDGLQRVMDAHRTMRLFPSFWCDPGADGSVKRVVHWQLQIASARANESSNSAITVRKMKDCSLEQADMQSEVLRPGDLDVFLSRRDFIRAFTGKDADRAAHCRQFAMAPHQGYMCSADWAADTALPLPELTLVDDRVTADFLASRKLDFSTTGNWEDFASSGWWKTSDGPFTWTEGAEAHLDLPIPPMARGANLVFDVYPFLAPTMPTRTVTVLAGDRVLSVWTFDAGGWTTRDVQVPSDLTGAPLHLAFRESATPTPHDLGVSEDPRHLGIAIRSMTMSEPE